MATSGRVNKPVAPELKEIREERILRAVRDRGHTPDGALQGPAGSFARAQPGDCRVLPLNFEGVSNQDNFNIFGFRVNPPDPIGDVGPNHYVEMINLVYAVYDKIGQPAARPGRHRHAVGGLRRSRTARIPRATPSSSTTSSRTAGS